jgi:hypothetical protein
MKQSHTEHMVKHTEDQQNTGNHGEKPKAPGGIRPGRAEWRAVRQAQGAAPEIARRQYPDPWRGGTGYSRRCASSRKANRPNAGCIVERIRQVRTRQEGR